MKRKPETAKRKKHKMKNATVVAKVNRKAVINVAWKASGSGKAPVSRSRLAEMLSAIGQQIGVPDLCVTPAQVLLATGSQRGRKKLTPETAERRAVTYLLEHPKASNEEVMNALMVGRTTVQGARKTLATVARGPYAQAPSNPIK